MNNTDKEIKVIKPIHNDRHVVCFKANGQLLRQRVSCYKLRSQQKRSTEDGK